MKAELYLTHLHLSKPCLLAIVFLVGNLHLVHSEMIIEMLPDADEDLVSCHVPTGEASYCVPLKRCHQINVLLAGLPKPTPPDITKFIKKSFTCSKKEFSDEDTFCCQFDSIIGPKLTDRPRIGNSSNVFVSITYPIYVHTIIYCPKIYYIKICSYMKCYC